MPLFKETLTGKIGLKVKSTDTIESVKQKIQNEEGIPSDEQYLVFDKLYLEDECTLQYYNIQNEDTVDFIRLFNGNMKVFIKNLDIETFSLNVKITDTIESIKQQIMNEKGIPTNEQRLTFEGRKLEDEDILQYYNIQNEATIDLARFDGFMKIYIKSSDNKSLSLNVKSTDTIESVKQKIQNEEGIPSDQG